MLQTKIKNKYAFTLFQQFGVLKLNKYSTDSKIPESCPFVKTLPIISSCANPRTQKFRVIDSRTLQDCINFVPSATESPSPLIEFSLEASMKKYLECVFKSIFEKNLEIDDKQLFKQKDTIEEFLNIEVFTPGKHVLFYSNYYNSHPLLEQIIKHYARENNSDLMEFDIYDIRNFSLSIGKLGPSRYDMSNMFPYTADIDCDIIYQEKYNPCEYDEDFKEGYMFINDDVYMLFRKIYQMLEIKIEAIMDTQKPQRLLIYFKDCESIILQDYANIFVHCLNFAVQRMSKKHRVEIGTIFSISPNDTKSSSNTKNSFVEKSCLLLKFSRSKWISKLTQVYIDPELCFENKSKLKEAEKMFSLLKLQRISSINLKQIKYYMKLKGIEFNYNPEDSLLFNKQLSSHILNISETLNIVTIANNKDNCQKEISSKGSKNTIGLEDLQNSLSIIKNINVQKKKVNKKHAPMEDSKNFTSTEETLLSCVVNPDNINVVFKDVHLEKRVISNVYHSVVLPLLKPDWFKTKLFKLQGTMGILLFGPPGTGKTMLAKAMAKQSGCIMLEIKACNINHSYVGESEKYIEAIFSLARKLSPCIIFFDEIDAVFKSRTSEDRSYRRDVINQFMVELDGIRSVTQDNHKVIVLGATNRPFDLDDAILRRFPKRLYIDLPNTDFREKIIKDLLQEEKLDPDFCINKLAKSTENYSGSDLKSMCLAASQLSIQEFLKLSINSDISEKYWQDTNFENRIEKLPVNPQFVISKEHFELAKKQVLPSFSKSMQSYKDLKKWNFTYGDRSGGEFSSVSMGFSNNEN